MWGDRDLCVCSHSWSKHQNPDGPFGPMPCEVDDCHCTDIAGEARRRRMKCPSYFPGPGILIGQNCVLDDDHDGDCFDGKNQYWKNRSPEDQAIYREGYSDGFSAGLRDNG